MHQNWVGIQAAFLKDEEEKLKKDHSLKSKLGVLVHQAVLHLVPFFVHGTQGVGHKTELYGTPYSLSEDIVSSYRMHPLIPDVFDIDGQKVNASDMTNWKARGIINRFGISKLAHAWGHQPPTTLTLHNYPDFLTKIIMPGEDGPRSMAVIDILRDRERGMVRYNQARRQYGLQAAGGSEDITDNADLVEELRSVYKSVEDVDFLVGCLAESPRPSGYVISNTAFYVFIINASRRILCDRFYQESYNAETYTAEGLAHVENTSFKSMLLRHHPELKNSIGDVTNAFMAWTGTADYSKLQPKTSSGGEGHAEL
ncbi:hypothetical protein CVIRNUC_000311 [Coccomyxa viridis]|uniref:Uncharacterized protein n=1 Tax=Coccomyxa viridis TaxID=1274662 RepID=A0AAV1HSQ4_9CHLO|nr:hypothetical protein CVIRNUC_000311 [Coccomyxa viridis]